MNPITDALTAAQPLQQALPAESSIAALQKDPKDVKAAKDFESLLLHKLLQEMAATVEDSPLLDETAGKQTKEMFWYYLSQDLADKGGLGLWKQIAGRQQYAAAQQEVKVNP